MSLSELETDQGRDSDHSCVVALYDLFKNAVAQQPQQRTQHLLSDSCPNHPLRGSSLADQASLTQPDLDELGGQQPEGKNDDIYILDVHSIAGLLKLYLRELPQPLFTFILYDDWIDCVSNEADSPSQRLEKLGGVAKRLPQIYYDNLKHLIKFLSELTRFQDCNKMTSTNLAIAMAPSLMWSRPPTRSSDQVHDNDQANDAQSLNSQMCSFGMSASQHAMILEALINNAASIFPEPSDFTLSEFTNLSLKFTDIPKRTASKREGRTVKSTSPTGLSTASSSSCSSNTSNSTASSVMNRGHSRKGGSMEGFLGGGMVNEQDIKNVTPQNMSTRSVGRPVSVQIPRDEYASIVCDPTNVQASNTPPKPPIPTTRSYSRQMSTESRNINSSHKPPAPPVPPPTSVRHQQERLKASFQSSTTLHSQSDIKPRPVSLRGTGTINSASTNQTAPTAARPSVPPPERPSLTPTTSVGGACGSIGRMSNKSAGGFTLLTSGAGLVKNKGNEVDESELGTLSSSSPIVSDDDSSFDDEESSDRSWTKDSNNEDEQHEGRSETLKPLVEANKISAQLDQVKSDRSHHSVSENTGLPAGGDDHVLLTSSYGASNRTLTDVKMNQAPPPKKPQPPAKPPHSTSPKIAQSTLL